ncbi:MAG: hypothetical protein WCX95_04670 [Candidatus Gracilibacteria bacterium]
MDKVCKQCGETFPFSEDDLAMLKKFTSEFAGQKFEMPEPTFCVDCRAQRRLAFLNQINLFRRKCDATGVDMVSNYPSNNPTKVYEQLYWYSDKWDALDYGKDFNENESFFEQMYELQLKVPVPALFTDYLHDENCEYTHCAGKNKNCYMIFDSDENWNLYYCYGVNGSKDSLDCYRGQKLELCYEVIDSNNCYKCAYTYNSSNCSESLFLNNCTGCRNCIYCSNLVNKQYHVFNENVGKERYEEIMKGFGSHEFLIDKIPQFEKFKLTFPQKYMRGVQNENVIGNHVINSKNAYYCFDSMNLWDCRYCYQAFISAKDSMDIQESGGCELNYETVNCAYNVYNAFSCFQCMDNCNNLKYCIQCQGCSNCFGCVGLKRKKYCILNKQYTPEEYEQLVAKIIKHMMTAGEYGEFFPIHYSSFGYNLTTAQEYFPLTKEEALAKGFKWYDIGKKEYQPATFELPDNIADVQPEIIKELLACEDCGRNYKIIEQELKLHQTLNLPLPRKCFYCRNLNRIKYRTPRKLYDRQCAKCSADLKTAYAPDRPEIIYCEKCYVENVF